MALPTNSGNNKPNSPSHRRDNSQENDTNPVGYPVRQGGLPNPNSLPGTNRAPMPPAPEEDDVFESLSMDEMFDDDEGVTIPTTPPLPPRQEQPRPDPIKQIEPVIDDFKSILDDPEPVPKPSNFQKERIDESIEESEFINEKKKKLNPFGGSKSKAAKDDKISLIDSREDRKKKATIVQAGVIVALVGMVGFGGYNAINPPSGVSASEMNLAIESAISLNDFPMERGAAFAEDFLTAYLEIDETSRVNEILGYYYTGVLGSEFQTSTIENSGVAQKILVQPKVFKSTIVSENSAAFEVGALVEPYQTRTTGEAEDITTSTPSALIKDRAKWVFYNVNVYYDLETDTMAITSDSPNLIPSINFAPSANIPEEKTLGDGVVNEEKHSQVKSSLEGYLNAFARSSAANYNSLEQFLIEGADSDQSLLKGLDGEFELDGEFDQAVRYVAYDGDTANRAKLDVYVKWKDAKFTDDRFTRLTYTSRYYIEMERQQGGQWLVTAFAPRYYTSAPVE